MLSLGDDEIEIQPLLTLPDGSKTDITPEKISSQRYTSRIEAPELGTYSASVNSAEAAGTYADSESGRISFIVVPPDKEVRGPTANTALLRSIASETGGNYIGVNDNPEKLKIDRSGKRTITGYETVELWDKPVFLLLIMALLFSDWFLRRRWGLR